MELERRVLAAILIVVLALGLGYVWEEQPRDGASSREQLTDGLGSEQQQTLDEDKSKAEHKQSPPRQDNVTGAPDEASSLPVNGSEKLTEKETKGMEQEEGSEGEGPSDDTVQQPPHQTEEPTPQPPTSEKPTNQSNETSSHTDDQHPPQQNQQKQQQQLLGESEFEALYHNVCPPESAGDKHISSNTTGELSNTVFVVNGLSAVGSRVAYMLAKDHQWEVLSISSSGDRLCGDKLMWYRQDMLRKKGVQSIFVDWSNTKDIGTLFKARRPTHVIVVPPNVAGSSSEYTLDASTWAGALHDFVALLETMRNLSLDIRLTLVSVSKSIVNELETVPVNSEGVSLIETLVGAFELSLSTYHTLYQIPFSVLRLERGVYGPWTHHALKEEPGKPSGCFIDDVSVIIRLALSLNYKCIVLDFGTCHSDYDKLALEKVGMHRLTSPAIARAVTDRWRTEYRAVKRSHVVLTSYFTGPGFNAAPNRFRKLQNWLESVNKHSLEAVVLHNGLDRKFIARCKKHYPQLNFKSVSLPLDFTRNSSCRQSLMAFANYLEHHGDIDRVLMMDLDRRLTMNIFPAMESLGDWLYSDLDLTTFSDTLVLSETKTSQDESDEEEEGVVFMESPVLGGSRELVLAALNKMAECLKSGWDTAALRCLVDKDFVQHAFMGWPLSISVS